MYTGGGNLYNLSFPQLPRLKKIIKLGAKAAFQLNFYFYTLKQCWY